MANFFAPSDNANAALGPQLQPWYPESDFKTFGSGLDVSKYTPEGQQFDVKKVSVAFLAEYYKKNPDSLTYRDGYEDPDLGVKHAWVEQTHDGIKFANTDGKVTFNRFNKVVTVSSSYVTLTTAPITLLKATLTLEEAIKVAEEALRGTYVPPTSPSASATSDDKSSLQFLANADGSATLVYSVPVKNDSQGTYFQAYVDAHEPKIVAATDYVAH
ncbi:hypothetical protein Agabi119p4_6239 [Agaricus bisporus var. burnettii]|nr:hypothetical protein Agabi119p4_6239 [Agaricus bisporus var. burnettii]